MECRVEHRPAFAFSHENAKMIGKDVGAQMLEGRQGAYPFTYMVGHCRGAGSLVFIFTWVNFVLGNGPAPQPAQVLAASLGIASGAYAAWLALRSRHHLTQ
jgi:hypothetical protein